jgi:hypothetical protein
MILWMSQLARPGVQTVQQEQLKNSRPPDYSFIEHNDSVSHSIMFAIINIFAY